MANRRLELTWSNKDLRLLSHDDVSYEWVQPDDWRVSEVRLLEHVLDIGEDPERNLVIQGDSLHALTSLTRLPDLAEKYVGNIRLCYIDPPFNTGQAFTNYDDAVEHSVWLTMLRDRLVQIHKLLAEDGSVWVHLDDAEAHRARTVLDEVFGAENFVSTFIWQKVDSPNDNKVTITADHEFIHVYAKSRTKFHSIAKSDDSILRGYGQTAADGRRYRDRLLKKNGKNSLREDRPTMFFPVTDPDGNEVWPIHDDGREACWALGAARVEQLAAEGLIVWKRRTLKGSEDERWVPYTREWAPAAPTRPWPTIWTDVLTSRQAKAHLRSLFPELDAFATPKPEALIARIIEIVTVPGDIVLDCFAGSGTTPAVAHKLQRRYVAVEMKSATLQNFILPRLTKVVEGSDDGGITIRTREVLVGDLPDGIDPTTVRMAAKTLLELDEYGSFADIPGADEKLISALTKTLRSAARTKREVERIWQGGGGFRFARVAPSMFEPDEDGDLSLAEWATGGELAAAVCAQLGYRYELAGPFAGIKGRSRLAVIDGMVTEGVARFLLSRLDEKQTLLVVAQAIEPGLADVLRAERSGSRATKMPRDLARNGILPSQPVVLKTRGHQLPEQTLDISESAGVDS